MSTIYTVNGKVLKNADNGKWLTKKEAPAGFVMDASNATISNNVANWEGPNYPDGYDGTGKTLQIIVKEEGFTCAALTFNYANSISGSGPSLTNGSGWNNPGDTGMGTYSIPVGTYNVSIVANPATSMGYGKYITLQRQGPDRTIDSALLAKIEFKIID